MIDESGKAVITDFGLSRILTKKGFTTKAAFLSLRWCAIEILVAASDPQGDIGEEEVYRLHTFASDIWAFGMTILQVKHYYARLLMSDCIHTHQTLTMQLPFPRLSDYGVIRKVTGDLFCEQLHYDRPDNDSITDVMWTLLQACWRTDPGRRPNAACLGLVLDLIYGYGTIGDEFDANSALKIINWWQDRADAHKLGDVPARYPYPCKWPDCRESFEMIDQCIEHECEEFRRWSKSRYETVISL